MRNYRSALILVLVLFGSLECLEPAPARLLVAADSVILNGPASFRLPIAVVDASGDTMSPRSVAFRTDANDVVELLHHGEVRCRRRGDAPVTVNLAGVSARYEIRCRPIDTFGMPFFSRLVVGGDPVLPTIVAYDSSGARVTELAGTARIRDSSVVRYSDGLLHAVDIGGTYLDVDFGGKEVHLPIQVIRRVASERLALAAGEIRSWPLPVGRSELVLASDSTNPAARQLLLLVYRANCARGARRAGEQRWHCIGTADSRAVVNDARPVGTGGAVRAEFTMFAMR
ncbi:MAG: hypothetical protein HY944_00180 [Gemmatimonadetes bacterium]|nr:hypothetical protein [Gemmatimonadota bacterium]